YLSTYQLLLASIDEVGAQPDVRSANEIGRLVAHLAGLRRMSTSIASMLQRGQQPTVEAALLKDMGTTFEREIPEVFRLLIPSELTYSDGETYPEILGRAVLH